MLVSLVVRVSLVATGMGWVSVKSFTSSLAKPAPQCIDDGAGFGSKAEEVEVEGGVGIWGDVGYVDGDDLFVVERCNCYFVALIDGAVGLDVEEGVGVV